MSDQSNKTIFILLDGCGFDAAVNGLGYIEHLIEKEKGAKYRVLGELPSNSRPIYETLLTGLPPVQHGILENMTPARSRKESIFSLCIKQELRTAAAAYHWISELYSSPFDPRTDRYQFDSGNTIQNGIYYFEDTYPDSHVFSDAEFLRCQYKPDFLMIHTMNCDDMGHLFGAQSKEYHGAVHKADAILALSMPQWLQDGWQIIITADHGMNELGLHGGNSTLQREVPLYLFSNRLKPGDFSNRTISQLLVAPLVCACLGIQPSEEMIGLNDMGVDFFAK